MADTAAESHSVIVKVKPEFAGLPPATRNPHDRISAAGAAGTIQRWCSSLGVHGAKPLWTNAVGIPMTEAGKDHPGARTFVLAVDSTTTPQEAVDRLRDLPWVEYAEIDRRWELHQRPSDPLYSRQWDLENTGAPYWSVLSVPGEENDTLIERNGSIGADIRFPAAYSRPGPWADVIVGVLDTGVDTGHVELRDNLARNSRETAGNGLDDDHNGLVDDVCGWDFSGNAAATPVDIVGDNDVADYMGHGTHVAGTIAATVDNGIGIAGICAPARILPVKIFPNPFFSVSAQAVYYAVARGARVINMSWGGQFRSRVLEDALAFAHDRGVVLVASMGNSGDDQIFYPSAYPQTIGVGATNARDELAGFSTYNEFIDLLAPGVDILSLRATGTDLYADVGEPRVHIIDNDYLIASGTSMAAPHVSGAAAVLLSFAPGLTNERIREILRATVHEIVGSPLAGRIDLETALAALPGLFVRIESPKSYEWIGGDMAIVGSATGLAFDHYLVLVAAGHPPADLTWTTITSAATPVDSGLLAHWTTNTAEGPYTIRLDAGPDARLDVPVYLVQRATARLLSPLPHDTIQLLRTIVGSAAAPGFRGYRLDAVGPLPNGDVHAIGTSNRPVWEDTLAVWRTDSLLEGEYFLILSVDAPGGGMRDSLRVTVQDAFMAGWPVTLPAPTHFAVTAVNLDGTAGDEVICPTTHGLHILRADGTPYPGWPRDIQADLSTACAIADLDLDGRFEVIVAGRDAMYAYAFIGEQYYSWPRPFDGRLNGIFGNSLPSVGDMDGRGALEVAAIDRNGAIHVWNEDGTRYVPAGGRSFGMIPYVRPTSSSPPQASICDLNRDGRPELIAVGDEIHIFDGQTALPMIGLDSSLLVSHYSIHAVVIGDFDDDNVRDIAYVATGSERGRYLINIVDVHGRSLPGWPRQIPQTWDKYVLYSLAAGDVDGDGTLELFAAPYSVGDGLLYAFHANGAPLGSDSTNGLLADLSGSLSSVALVDIDGDDAPEIVLRVGDLLFGPDQIVALKPDGRLVPGYPINFGYGSSPIIPAPLVGDIDRDGRTDMVTVQSTSENVAAWELGTPAGTRGRPWPRFLGDLWNSGVAITPRYDVVYLVRLINMTLRRGTPLPPYEPSDIDGNGTTEIADIIYLAEYLFRNGPAPCAP
ncbi:MAG: S8 family serine peptidase [Candidatus Zixiibacteriota bacterium]